MNIDEPAQVSLDTNVQPELDTSAAIAEISSDLFGQGSEDDKASAELAESPASAEVAAVETPSSEKVEGEAENSAEVQALGAPSTWTKEALEGWASIPPRQQQEILKREEDMHRGLEQYKGAAEVGQRYESVVEPYKALLTAEQIDPVQLFNSFASNHYLLTRGTPEQKVEIAATMLSHYGVQVNDLIDYFGDQILNPVDPRVARLEQELQGLRQAVSQQSTQITSTAQTAIEAEIANFASDPANPYFNELVDDIAKFMETGVANTLKEAYEKAVYANPVTRQKELDRLTADKKSQTDAAEKARRDKLAQSTAANVNATAHQRDGTIPVGSMDDTLNSTLAAIQGRA